jgi:8-oxo-dGTP pyrophosphatase MutT (NUDIX family)
VPERATSPRPDDRWPPEALDEVRLAIWRHRPDDSRETNARVRILAELYRLAAPFDEDADPVHVTASAIVVGARGTVLHVHKRLGRWMQPGGHVEPGEWPWQAAVREAREETGLALAHPVGGPRLLHVDVHAAAKGHTHLDLRYLVVGCDDDPTPLAGESPHARWYSWPEALAMADDALVNALRVALRRPEVRADASDLR